MTRTASCIQVACQRPILSYLCIVLGMYQLIVLSHVALMRLLLSRGVFMRWWFQMHMHVHSVPGEGDGLSGT